MVLLTKNLLDLALCEYIKTHQYLDYPIPPAICYAVEMEIDTSLGPLTHELFKLPEGSFAMIWPNMPKYDQTYLNVNAHTIFILRCSSLKGLFHF